MNLSEYDIPSSDQRRKVQGKFERHMPADAAAALSALISPARDNADWTPVEHDSGLTVFRNARVLVPLIEPNSLAFGRMISDRYRAARPSTASDGVMVAEWDSPADHAASISKTVSLYIERHGMVEQISETCQHQGLDSWHSPLALVPVRHIYRDGSKPVLRWMSADGTARIVGARLGYALSWNSWLTDHPYTDASAPWPGDVVTLRKFFAAARNESRRLADERNAEAQANGDYDPDYPARPEHFLHAPRIEDWADIVLPQADTTKHSGGLTDRISVWNFRTHSSGGRNEPNPQERYTDDVYEAIMDLDAFSGTDPYDLYSLDPADKDSRADIADKEQEVRDFLFSTSNSESRQASRFALFSIAALDGKSMRLPDGKSPYTLIGEYETLNLGQDTANSAQTAAALASTALLLHKFLGEPDLSELFGVYLDVDAGTPAEVLSDPTNPWFWLGAAQGIGYAILLGHLRYIEQDHEAFLRAVTWMFATPTGQAQTREYLIACQQGKVRVPLAGQDGQFASRKGLEDAVNSHLTPTGNDEIG